MAPFGRIYQWPHFRSQRAKVVAAYNGLEVPYVEDWNIDTDKRDPEFLAKFPRGKVPALECADGFCLTESGAICNYIARSGPKAAQLLGSDIKTQAIIEHWVFFAEDELNAGVLPPAGMVHLKYLDYDEAVYDKCSASLEASLKYVEFGLQGKEYLVGDDVTMADIVVAGPIWQGAQFLIDAEMRKNIPNVVAWLNRLAEFPEFEAFGKLNWIETRVKP
ncbi:hypothetical protein M426DRAFT_27277 [Hypoxylon sp. CI-4A]|nr:hypothetical protein M426DRAFT_27277 [Hypoxylon sp. CI-4A]